MRSTEGARLAVTVKAALAPSVTEAASAAMESSGGASSSSRVETVPEDSEPTV